MNLSDQEAQAFIQYVQDIITSEEVMKMKNYIQHGNTTTFQHCLMVSYYSYLTALRLPFQYDLKSVVRGSMLHDFYLYDWHIPHKSHKFHGFVHPGFALSNARKYFQLNPIEADIIEKHMWPLTIHKVPAKKEAFLVCMIDKYCSLAETFHISILPKESKRLFGELSF